MTFFAAYGKRLSTSWDLVALFPADYALRQPLFPVCVGESTPVFSRLASALPSSPQSLAEGRAKDPDPGEAAQASGLAL